MEQIVYKQFNVTNEQKNEPANQEINSRRIESNKFNANKRLPKDFIIETAGYHLYTLGITNQHFNKLFIQKRNKINNPITRFISQLILLIRCSISIFITDKE